MLEGDKRSAAITSIADFFRTLNCPSSVRPDAWQALLGVAADPARFEKIIAGFQWSTGANAALSMEDRVQSLLVSRGFTSDSAIAKRQHDHLFAFLVRVLSRPKSEGDRRLRCADLSARLTHLRFSQMNSASLTRSKEPDTG